MIKKMYIYLYTHYYVNRTNFFSFILILMFFQQITIKIWYINVMHLKKYHFYSVYFKKVLSGEYCWSNEVY